MLPICRRANQIPNHHRDRLSKSDRLAKLSALCLSNAQALQQAYQHCVQLGVYCFRINSQILPGKTHEQVGYQLKELPNCTEILDLFQKCGEFAREHELRASSHPDQLIRYLGRTFSLDL